MTALVATKLLALLATVALGWTAGRLRLLGEDEPARVLASAAFYLFVPALLARTTARLDLATLPWALLAAFFVPVLGLIALVYLWARRRRRAAAEPRERGSAAEPRERGSAAEPRERGSAAEPRERGSAAEPRERGSAAEPSVRAITSAFGNTLQVGIPMAAGVFGEAGLALHITVVSVHALVLLIVLTVLVELDLAREQATQGLAATLALTVRNTVVHPVVLPVIVGLGWNLSGLPLPAVVDEALRLLGTAVVPLCLTLIGLSLAQYGWPRAWRGLAGLVLLKLLVQPGAVLVCAHWGFGLTGLPLAVVVMLAALPVGSNALIFAQRYRCLEAETTAATVLSTVLYGATAPLWLALLAWAFPW